MLSCRSLPLFAVALLLTALLGSRPQQLVAADPKDLPWPSGVPNFQAPASGEHPRLFFRKADLAEIRKRAATAEGKAILAKSVLEDMLRQDPESTYAPRLRQRLKEVEAELAKQKSTQAP